jgi:Spy/CpxP family protein refolding chaperone
MAIRSSTLFNPARLFGGAVLVAVLSSAALSVWAQGGPGGYGGPGMHGMHGGGAMMGMPMQGRMVDRMLDSVNASAEQRAQVKQITERAGADMRVQHGSAQALREQGMKLFAQPVVDAAAVEALRQQMMQQHDQRSRQMVQTMLEVSRVLTPEQRKTLSERMAMRGEMTRRHMQERQSLEGKPTPR